MVERVGAGLAVVEMRWRDPFGVTPGVFAGGPAAVEEFVVGSASQGELVDIGATGGGPLPYMMDLAAIHRHITARR